MEINWNKIRRKQFPALKYGIHLKAAGGSPMSTASYQSGIRYFNEMYKQGDIFWDNYFSELNLARKIVAQYINSNPNEIAFLINTSSCMNAIARLLKSGELIYPEGEFPTSVHIFKMLGFNCKEIKSNSNNKYLIKNFTKNLSPNTRYLIVSHVQYLTGFRQDLEKLGTFCKEYNLVNIINATQSFGAFPIDVKKQNIDILVASALKWACCGYGIGILYINQNIVKKNKLPFSSWLSVEEPFSMDNNNLNIIKKTKSMDGLGGTPNFPALLTLNGGLGLIEEIGRGNIQIGVNKIYKRIIWLTSEFVKEIKLLKFKIITPLDIEHRSGIITIEHANAERIFYELLRNKIYISLRNYPKSTKKTLLRFSFNYYNNLGDIEKTIRILKRVTKNEY